VALDTNVETLPPTPDFDSYPVPAAIIAVTVEPGGGVLRLDWSNGRTSRYHAIWLRDNASDTANLNPETREQWRDVSALPESVSVASAEIDASGALCVRWAPEDLVSRFHPGWLYAHDYSTPCPDATTEVTPATWDGRSLPEPPTFAGAHVLDDDDVLEAWLEAIATNGIARLSDVPAEPGMVARVAERLGPVRESNFGRIFDVKVKTGPGSNAYTAVALTPHTDLPTREYQPGLQFLHCLQASCRGGRAIMIDGFALAERLKAREPGAYRALTEIPWPMNNRAPDSDYRWRSPVIRLDHDGAIQELRVAPFLRAPLEAPFDQVEEAYRALRIFFEAVADPDLRMSFDYRPGDLVAMDNRRVLHGREAYDPGVGERWLQGCYGEREELYSRLRILARRRRAAELARRLPRPSP
jgi:gamma-butyrobetaine dioxygenase